MSRVTRARNVAAPPPAVWALLAAFDSIVEWAPNVDHSCLLTEQVDDVGAVRRVQSGPVTLVERVITWEPGLMVAYTIEGLPPIVRRATNTWVVRPSDGGAGRDGGDGGTSVTVITDIEMASSPLGVVAGRIVGRKLGEASDTMLDGLARAVSQTRMEGAS